MQQTLNSWLRLKAGHADEVDEENEHFVETGKGGVVGFFFFYLFNTRVQD